MPPAQDSRQPQPSGPPREQMRPLHATPPGRSQWPGGPQPPRETGPAGPGGPSGQDYRPRQERQPPGPGSSTGWPPRGPGYPAPGRPGYAPGATSHAPGATSHAPGAATHAPGGASQAPGGPGHTPGGPGYVPPGGRRPAPPRAPGPQGSPGTGTFTGGYAPVIRATDLPGSEAGPGRADRAARPGSPDGPRDDDVYVYRDPAAQPGRLAGQGREHPRERDAAYWYDLSAEPAVPERHETRGPFEPLVSSSGPPPNAARRQPGGPAAAARTPGPPAGHAEEPGQDPAGHAGLEEPGHAQARKLEQIKDLYLTAEAIGEENVDKHFDQLLAQQRELISEYFRQSAAARHADGLPAQADANPIEPRQPGGGTGRAGQGGPPEGASVAAEPPWAW